MYSKFFDIHPEITTRSNGEILGFGDLAGLGGGQGGHEGSELVVRGMGALRRAQP